MSGKKYVPEGVFLVCDMGTVPAELRSISYTETTLFGEHMCTKMDKTLIVNFEPLGVCSASNGAPCTAPVLDWTNVTDGITLGGNELLLEDSELPCTLGGTVKIFYSMAAAMAALPEQEEEKGFWDNALDFTKGLGTGLWKGAKGTVTGVADLVVWAGKHSTPYMLLNPQGYAEQLQKDKETFKAIGNMAVKAGTFVYRNSAVNALTDPSDYMAAQAESAEMAEQMMDKAANMSAEEWGDFTGQVLFEVLMEVGTAGGAAALTAAKVADKTVDAARALDKIADLGDAAKAADKLQDISDGTKLLPPPKELGNTAKAGEKIQDGTKLEVPKELGNVEYFIKRIKKIKSKPFKRNSKHDADEFLRQLKGQENGLNNISVDDFIKNRDEYLKNGRSSAGSKAQKDFREKALQKKIDELEDSGLNYGDAKTEASKWMDTQAALHDPDQIAGGFGDNVTGMGDKRVNSSLGSQWKSRINDIDEQVREAAKNMTQAERESTLLNIELPGL